MTILTKADILNGVNSLKKVNIEAQGYGTFNASSIRGQTTTDGKMNLAKVQEKQAEAKYHAIHISINNKKNDEWEYEEIKQLPSDAIDEIYTKIMDLSGVDVTERDMKQFPEDK